MPQNTFDLTTLGLSTRLQESIHIALKRGSGFIGITGPTGSGKTRTLYALLQQLHAHGKLIYSIEDPIELNLANITQIEVDPHSSFNFTYAFKKYCGTIQMLLPLEKSEMQQPHSWHFKPHKQGI